MQPCSAASGFNIIAFCPFLGDTIATVSAAPAACVITPPLRSGDTIIRCLRGQRYTIPSSRSPYMPQSNFFPVQLSFSPYTTTFPNPLLTFPRISPSRTFAISYLVYFCSRSRIRSRFSSPDFRPSVVQLPFNYRSTAD